MTPCYNPPAMDKENLRKQIYEEIQSQFETKLREAKREKSQLEEEIESASEKWRAERRRLNSEIDRLETKLAETRETRRKAPDSKAAKAADPQEVDQIHAAAEERIKRAAQAFDSDREKLQAEISRLQRGIADLIERSNNPLRASQAEKEKYETRLEDAVRAKRLAEDALLAAKADWEQEKLKLVAETIKLRRPAPEKPKSGRDDEFVQQMEKKLDETLRSRDKLADEFDKVKTQTRFKQEEFDALTLQLDQSKKERANLEKQLRELSSNSGQASAKQAPSEELSALTEQLDKSQKERANLERQLRESSRSQEKLERELDKVRQSPIVMKRHSPLKSSVSRRSCETRAQRRSSQEAQSKKHAPQPEKNAPIWKDSFAIRRLKWKSCRASWTSCSKPQPVRRRKPSLPRLRASNRNIKMRSQKPGLRQQQPSSSMPPK